MVLREHETVLVLVLGMRLCRDCMKAVLDNHENLHIALDAKSLLDVFNMERPPQADVIIAEDTQLGDDKIQALKTLIKEYPRSKPLLICFGTDEDILIEYINAGAYG